MREFLIALMLVVAFVVGGTQVIVQEAEAAGEAEVASETELSLNP